MKNLIERYVYDVVRRLPENERDEVSRELKSNIYDMLPDDAGDDEIEAALRSLGSPASLAEKYRQKPRYLISPAVYDEYVSVIKWVAPLVGSVALIIGAVSGIVRATGAGTEDLSRLITNAIAGGLSSGISSAVQTLIWVTLGFTIAERVGAKSIKDDWDISDLPDTLPDEKSRIPLSEGIVGMALTTVFTTLAILICIGKLNLPVVAFRTEDVLHIVPAFNPDFLAGCVIPIAAIGIAVIVESAVKIKCRRWTPLVCAVVVAQNIVSAALLLYLLSSPNLFSAEFSDFMSEVGFKYMRFLAESGINPLVAGICAIIIAASILDCGSAIYKTIRYRKSLQDII